MHIRENVLASVGHRQYVFTIPKRLRIFFRFDRKLLGGLARCAWETVRELAQTALDGRDAVPGMVAAIQTFGELVHFHPHIHALVTDCAFAPDGESLPLPHIPTAACVQLFRAKVFRLLLDAGKIRPELVQEMLAWQHPGFSVDRSVHIGAHDGKAAERLLEYFLRCPFSLDRIVAETAGGGIIYRAEHNSPQRFPDPADTHLCAGSKRNFQIFTPLDFLAEVTQHIPDKGAHLVRYYGWYSNKNRGLRAKARAATVPAAPEVEPAPGGDDAAFRRRCRMRWAALIKKVYEVDPLNCPNCGGTMAVVSFITQSQPDVIARILEHCGLVDDPPRARAPPATADPDAPGEILRVDYETFLMACRAVA